MLCQVVSVKLIPEIFGESVAFLSFAVHFVRAACHAIFPLKHVTSPFPAKLFDVFNFCVKVSDFACFGS